MWCSSQCSWHPVNSHYHYYYYYYCYSITIATVVNLMLSIPSLFHQELILLSVGVAELFLFILLIQYVCCAISSDSNWLRPKLSTCWGQDFVFPKGALLVIHTQNVSCWLILTCLCHRSSHNPGESTEVPIQPPCRSRCPAAEKAGECAAISSWLPASLLLLFEGQGWALSHSLELGVVRAASPLSSLFPGRRGSRWQWLFGMVGLGWRCHRLPVGSLPFALEEKVRNMCSFHCGTYCSYFLVSYNMELDKGGECSSQALSEACTSDWGEPS